MVSSLLQRVTSPAAPNQAGAAMFSIAESPAPRNRSNTFSNDSDSLSLNSNSFPRRRKGLMQRSTSGLQALFRTFIPEQSNDALQSQGSNADLLYPQKAIHTEDRPRRKSDSADELLRGPSRQRKMGPVEVNPMPYPSLPPGQGPHSHPHDHHSHATAAQLRYDVGEIRYRSESMDHYLQPRMRLVPQAPATLSDAISPTPSAYTQGTSRRQTTSKLGFFAPECCTAASIRTPKNDPAGAELHPGPLYAVPERDRQHVRDVKMILAGIDRSLVNGGKLGLSLLDPVGADAVGAPDYSLPTSRSSPALRPPAVPPKPIHERGNRRGANAAGSQARAGPARSQTPRMPRAGAHPGGAAQASHLPGATIPAPKALDAMFDASGRPMASLPFPYQLHSKAGNSALSLTNEFANQSTASLCRPETLTAVPGLAGLPDEGKGILQRRARKPLELGFFKSEAEKHDAAQLSKVASGKALHSSISMPSMVPGPKSPGSLRSPPPFPPPSMPLPAIPNRVQAAASSRHLHATGRRGKDPEIYGKHSPICNAVDLFKQEQGRSRSASLDTPSATTRPNAARSSEGRKALDLGTSCTFTPIADLNQNSASARDAAGMVIAPHAPQVELSFLSRSSASTAGNAPINSEALGNLRLDLSNYGRTSLEGPFPLLQNGVNTLPRAAHSTAYQHHALEHSPARSRQLTSPPASPPPSGTGLTRSDSRGRRSSITMLPYKSEPSWSVSSQASPSETPRELHHSDRNAPTRTSSSSLRHMAAFISSAASPRPPQGTGHVATSSGGSLSSRETSPLLPMLHSSSHAGSSASSASIDGPNTPAESISERFQTAEAVIASRRSNSVPRILLLGSPELPAGYEHLMRRPEIVAPTPAHSKVTALASALKPSITAPSSTQTVSSPSALQAPATDTLTVSRSPTNLSPILGSSAGSQETHGSSMLASGPHSARSSGSSALGAILPHFILNDRQASAQRNERYTPLPLPMPPQRDAPLIPVTAPLSFSPLVSGEASLGLGIGRPSHLAADTMSASHSLHRRSYSPIGTNPSPRATAVISPTAGAALPERGDSGLGWNHGTTPSRKGSFTSSRHGSGSFRRHDDVEFGMAM